MTEILKDLSHLHAVLKAGYMYIYNAEQDLQKDIKDGGVTTVLEALGYHAGQHAKGLQVSRQAE